MNEPMAKEAAESEMLEHEGDDDVRFKDLHERVNTIEKMLRLGKYAPKKKTDMERMKERKRHT